MAGTVVACLKHVALRVRVDPLTGDVSAEPHATGMSDADRAALEWALRLGEHWGRDVVAVTAGPAAAAGGTASATSPCCGRCSG
jgi:electron transfer flavoprotein alpha/beta subunit